MKYVTLWEIDQSKIPTDPNERTMLYMKMTEMTKQWLKENPSGEWGAFIGENMGYSTGMKTPQEIIKLNMMFTPYVKFKTYQAATIDELEAIMKAMMPPK